MGFCHLAHDLCFSYERDMSNFGNINVTLAIFILLNNSKRWHMFELFCGMAWRQSLVWFHLRRGDVTLVGGAKLHRCFTLIWTQGSQHNGGLEEDTGGGELNFPHMCHHVSSFCSAGLTLEKSPLKELFLVFVERQTMEAGPIKLGVGHCSKF